MTNGNLENSGQAGQAPADDVLESLFRQASARKEPSEDDRLAVRSAVREEWLNVTGRRRWRRRAVGFSVAAAALVASMLVLIDSGRMPVTPALQQMAGVERLNGEVLVNAQGSTSLGAALALRAPLYPGQAVTTGSGAGLGLRLESGISLRIDENSRIALVNGATVELERGRVYVDTEAESPGPAGAGASTSRFEILTSHGAVRHLGTQYMVDLGHDALRVNVRRGVVQLAVKDDAKAAPVYIPGGQQLALEASGQPVLSPGDAFGDEWLWAEALAPGYRMDGRTMAEFLEWVSSETGYEIVYETEQARTVAEDTVLHGEIDLPARKALDVVVRSSDLVAELEDGIIEISIER